MAKTSIKTSVSPKGGRLTKTPAKPRPVSKAGSELAKSVK